MINNRISFNYSEVFDFLGCMGRISFDDSYKALNLPHYDEFIRKWVDDIKHDLSSSIQEDLNFFLDTEFPMAFGTLEFAVANNIINVENFIDTIGKTDSNELVLYLIQNNDSSLSIEKLLLLKKSGKLYDYIEDNYPISIQNKWKVLSVISQPDKYKTKFVSFLKAFFYQYYEPVRQKSLSQAAPGIEAIINYIKEDPELRIKEIALINASKDTSQNIIIGFSYFSEFGVSINDNTATGNEIILMGSERLSMFKLMSMDSLSDGDIIGICRVIGDNTRIEILKMLKDGPIYGTQIAEKFNMSNPAVSYHLEQFASTNLVKVQKEGHRLYYYLKPEKIEQLIKYLRELINKIE